MKTSTQKNNKIFTEQYARTVPIIFSNQLSIDPWITVALVTLNNTQQHSIAIGIEKKIWVVQMTFLKVINNGNGSNVWNKKYKKCVVEVQS